MKVDIYIASDTQKPKRQDRWIGYLIQAEGLGQRGERIGTSLIEATSFRAILLAMVETLDRFTRPAEITMHIESEWIIGNIKRLPQKDGDPRSVLEMWQENGWKTARGTEVKNRQEWQRLYNKLRVFEHSGATFAFEKLEKDDKKRIRILRAIESEMEQED